MPVFGRAVDGQGMEFRVEIALGLESSDGSGVWGPDPNEGIWDESLWNGVELYWVDVTSRAISAVATRGRDRFEQRFRTGNASFVFDNDDGIFSPDGGAIGDLRFRPGRWIRLSARVDLNPYKPIWLGYIDTIADVYSEAAGSINSRMICYDHMGNLAIDDPPALETPVPQELSSERVSRILDLNDWPDVWRQSDIGLREVIASDLPSAYLEEIQIAADSEGGAFYILPSGETQFRNRDYLESPRSANVQAQIGLAFDPEGIQVLRVVTDWSTQRVANDVRFAREGGTEQRVIDDASISTYQRRTFKRSNFQNTNDTEILELANEYLDAFKWDHLRIEELTTVALSSAAASEVLELELADRVRVQVRTLQGWDYTMEAWINRFTWAVSSGDYELTLRVDNVDRSDPFDRSGFDDGFDEEGFGV